MYTISAETFLLWKEKQIIKGGDNKSLSLLIDLLGGLSETELNLLDIRSEKNIQLRINLTVLWKCVRIQMRLLK